MSNDFYLLISAVIGAVITIFTILVKGCIMSKCSRFKMGCIEVERPINIISNISNNPNNPNSPNLKTVDLENNNFSLSKIDIK